MPSRRRNRFKPTQPTGSCTLGLSITRPRIIGAAAAAVLATGSLAMTADASAATVACPTVDQSTGAVSPAPAAGVDWAGCDLARADLAGADLSHAALTGADLADANLSAADLDSAGMELADLSGANLSAASLAHTVLERANLAGVALGGATLTNDELYHVSSGQITGTPVSLPPGWSLTSGYLVGPAADLTGADLADANMASADLQLAELTNADLAGADLTSADLTEANLGGCNLDGANLSDLASAFNANLACTIAGATVTGAQLGGASLGGALGQVIGIPAALPMNYRLVDGYFMGPNADLAGLDLAGLNLIGVDLISGDLASTNLTNADLTNALLVGANVSGTELAGADIAGVVSQGSVTGTPASLPANWQLRYGYLLGPATNLDEALMVGDDLSGLDLAGASIGHADLTDADLDNTDLSDSTFDDVNLTGATFAGADVTGAMWSDTTCPDGTNSNAHTNGCLSPLDTTPPAAHPAVTAGKAGTRGWYTTPVTVTWNWTDKGTITNQCTTTSTASANGKAISVTASCTDLAGNTGRASFVLKIDRTRPKVTITGVRNHRRYRKGHVPIADCRTTETVSGVATPAKRKITTTGRHGLGTFTVTCSGAVSVSGTHQARTQRVTYTVIR